MTPVIYTVLIASLLTYCGCFITSEEAYVNAIDEDKVSEGGEHSKVISLLERIENQLNQQALHINALQKKMDDISNWAVNNQGT